GFASLMSMVLLLSRTTARMTHDCLGRAILRDPWSEIPLALFRLGRHHPRAESARGGPSSPAFGKEGEDAAPRLHDRSTDRGQRLPEIRYGNSRPSGKAPRGARADGARGSAGAARCQMDTPGGADTGGARPSAAAL